MLYKAMVSGIIKGINADGSKKSLSILDVKGNEYIFHINPDTIVMAFENLKKNQKVDILYDGILTRSIPPQGNALLVNGLKI